MSRNDVNVEPVFGVGVKIQGHLRIDEYATPDDYRRKTNATVLLNKRNAVHKDNAAALLALALTSRFNTAVSYMVFGNGGVTFNGDGSITPKPPNVSNTSDLYHQTLFKLVDDRRGATPGNQMAIRHISGTHFADAEIRCLIRANEPFGQLARDEGGNLMTRPFVFNEIGLKTQDGRLITHVTFTPVLKQASRILEVIYTLRMSVGEPMAEVVSADVQLLGVQAESEVGSLGPVDIPSKFYFEATILNTGNEYSACIGIAGAGFQLDAPADLDVNFVFSTLVNGLFFSIKSGGGGVVWGNPSKLWNAAGATANQVIGIAVDVHAKKFWSRNCTTDPTTWFGQTDPHSPDPTTGEGGVRFDSDAGVVGLDAGSPISGDIYILGGGGHDLTAPTQQWTITDTGLTATTTTINHNDTIIGTESNTTGKFYFEFTNHMSGDADLEWGISTSAQGKHTLIGNSVGVGWRRNTQDWLNNNTNAASGMAKPADGEVIGIAVDLTNSLIWIRNVTADATTWYGDDSGTPDPATGIDGFAFSSFVAPMFLAFNSNENGVAEGATMNGGGSAFAAAAPSGFAAWNSTDQWDSTFGDQPQYASLELNTGATTFTADPPTGYIAWDTSGGTTWNPDDNTSQVLTNGNLTLTASANPTSAPNQPAYFVRSTTHKAQF